MMEALIHGNTHRIQNKNKKKNPNLNKANKKNNK